MASMCTLVLALVITAVFALPRQVREAEEPVDYRLPDYYQLVSYNLDLKVPSEAFTADSNEYTGTVTIRFKFTENTNYIALHAHHDYIQINSVTFNNILLVDDEYVVDSNTNILKINVVSPITIGNTYALIIEFTGTLSTTEMYGFYKSSYVDTDGTTKYLATTQFEPSHARQAFPCFDEPAFKATFDVSITYPSNLNVLFNTEPIPPSEDDNQDPLTSDDDGKNNNDDSAASDDSKDNNNDSTDSGKDDNNDSVDSGDGKEDNVDSANPDDDKADNNVPADSTDQKDDSNLPIKPVDGSDPADSDKLTTVTFQTTPKLSTYLIAIIISEFTCSDAIAVDKVTYRVCSREQTSSERNVAVDVGPNILAHLNTFTDYNYNKIETKMDLVAIPDMAPGAMENWGLLTFREVELLWSEDDSSNRYKQVITNIVAHEISHQWFGDLVTCNWWSDIFLNEGFATYFQYQIPHEIFPEWELDKQFVLEETQRVLDYDELKSIQALESDASTPKEVGDKFGDISYDKGASIWRMVANFMGKDHFKEGLQLYLKNKEYSNAIPEDVWDALSQYIVDEVNLPADLPTVMENWIKKSGYPVVNVKFNGNNVTISQQRVLRTGRDFCTQWYIPISYTTSSDENKFANTAPNVWLTPDDEEKIIPLPDGADWIILNNQETGYYRVNYDDTLWSNIRDALQSDDFGGIADINRAQIVDDVFSLAKIGAVNYTHVLDITGFLADDTSYYPWYPAFDEYDFLLRRVGEDSNLGKAISKYLMTLMDTLYNSVPFNEQKPNDQIYTLKQELVLTWACKIGHEDCVNTAKDLFDNYVSTDKKPDRNLRSVVYCNGLRYAENGSGWEYLWNAYTETDDLGTEKMTIITALGCTKDTDLLNTYLQNTIADDSKIRLQDTSAIFSAVYSGNAEGVGVAYDFLKQNYQKIAEKYPSSSLGDLLQGITERFTTQDQINQLRDFLSTENLPDNLKSAGSQVLQAAELNQAWLTDYQQQLSDLYSGAGQVTVSLLGIFLAIVVNRFFFC